MTHLDVAGVRIPGQTLRWYFQCIGERIFLEYRGKFINKPFYDIT